MNNYDNIQLDSGNLCKAAAANSRYDLKAHSGQQLGLITLLTTPVNRFTTAVLYRTGILRRLVYSNFKLNWFYEFRDYWINGLGLRRIEPHDFFFLSCTYRKKFQFLSIDESKGARDFLATWQSPETIYLLFAYQYKLALHPLSAHTLAKYIKSGSKLCEYGCGLAPITQSLVKYYPSLNLNITAADIPSFLLHFVHWKFNSKPYVNIIHINPADDTPLTDKYDVITCMTVFEHLPNPLPIVKHLHNKLKPGGLFMFDYIKSEGEGLDTERALADRRSVLKFINNNYNIIRGSIPVDGSNVKSVLCSKK